MCRLITEVLIFLASLNFKRSILASLYPSLDIWLRLAAIVIDDYHLQTTRPCLYELSLISLWYLLLYPDFNFFIADKYLSNVLLDPTSVHGDLNKIPYSKEKSFLNDSNPFVNPAFARDDLPLAASNSEESRFLDQKLEESKKLMASVVALKDLVCCCNRILVYKYVWVNSCKLLIYLYWHSSAPQKVLLLGFSVLLLFQQTQTV